MQAAFSTHIRDLVDEMMAATIRAILVLVILSVASLANAQPSSGYPSALDKRSMSQAMLDAHNAVRARVGVPPLV